MKLLGFVVASKDPGQKDLCEQFAAGTMYSDIDTARVAAREEFSGEVRIYEVSEREVVRGEKPARTTEAVPLTEPEPLDSMVMRYVARRSGTDMTVSRETSHNYYPQGRNYAPVPRGAARWVSTEEIHHWGAQQIVSFDVPGEGTRTYLAGCVCSDCREQGGRHEALNFPINPATNQWASGVTPPAPRRVVNIEDEVPF